MKARSISVAFDKDLRPRRARSPGGRSAHPRDERLLHPKPFQYQRLAFSDKRSTAGFGFKRKDDIAAEFVQRAFGLPRVAIGRSFMPSSQGRLQALLAGWGVSVVPELRVRRSVERCEQVNLLPRQALPVPLYWHCWNLASDVLDAPTRAIV